jgi:hypothetical protein
MNLVNMLIVLLLCAVVGAFTGLLLGDVIGELYLGILAGLLATVIAVIARNVRLPQLVIIYSALAIERRIPINVVIYSLAASIIAGAAAVGIATEFQVRSPIVIGALGGLFAGFLTATLVWANEMHGNQSRGS